MIFIKKKMKNVEFFSRSPPSPSGRSLLVDYQNTRTGVELTVNGSRQAINQIDKSQTCTVQCTPVKIFIYWIGRSSRRCNLMFSFIFHPNELRIRRLT